MRVPQPFASALAGSRISAFPPTKRPSLQTTVASVEEIRVRTEDDLQAALTGLPYGSSPSCYGRVIEIAADIAITKPIVLWARHSGLRITSLGRAQFHPTASTNGLPLFRMNYGATTTAIGDTADIMLDGFGVVADGAVAFSSVVDFVSTNARFTLSDVSWTAPSLTTTNGAGGISAGAIIGNQRVHSSLVTAVDGISASATRSVVSFNRGDVSSLTAVRLTSSIGAGVVGNSYLGPVTLFASCAGCTVALNTGIGLVTTTASNGNNIIACNSAVTGYALHATDVNGLNT